MAQNPLAVDPGATRLPAPAARSDRRDDERPLVLAYPAAAAAVVAACTA
ncbi:hypothetical protein [Streptomyces tsukubensis]